MSELTHVVQTFEIILMMGKGYKNTHSH